jgi:hypothetical protein
MKGYDFFKQLSEAHRNEFRVFAAIGFGLTACLERECSSMAEFLLSAKKMNTNQANKWLEIAKEYEP